MARNEAHVVRINGFSYANNVGFVSLNIMFLTACEFINFRARVSATLDKCIWFHASLLPVHGAQIYLSLTLTRRQKCRLIWEVKSENLAAPSTSY